MQLFSVEMLTHALILSASKNIKPFMPQYLVALRKIQVVPSFFCRVALQGGSKSATDIVGPNDNSLSEDLIALVCACLRSTVSSSTIL